MSFLCGPVVKKPPASARNMGPIPGLGRSPYALELLSLYATTTVPVLSSLRVASREATATRSPSTAMREDLCVAVKT